MRRNANTCHTGATVWGGGGIREDIREEREAKKKKPKGNENE